MAELLLTLKIEPPARPRTSTSDTSPIQPPQTSPNKEPLDPLPAPTVTGKEDPFLLSQAMFRAGQFEDALAAYRRLDPESLGQEERVIVQYLSPAACVSSANWMRRPTCTERWPTLVRTIF